SDAIRILTLKSRTAKSLRCEIGVDSLQRKSGRYDALSYTWGSSGRQENIIVDGKRLAIRQNLWSFLVELYDRYGQIDVWADAICIDQESAVEKNHQVQRMSQIYSEARQIHVWLGSNTSEELIAALSAPESKHFSLSDNVFHELFDNAYWMRVWIIQELVLA